MPINSVFRRLASASCSKLRVIINAIANSTPVNERINKRVISGSRIYRFPRMKENTTERIISSPITVKRNWGHCHKEVLYLLHSSAMLNFRKNSPNVIEKLYHRLKKLRKNARV